MVRNEMVSFLGDRFNNGGANDVKPIVAFCHVNYVDNDVTCKSVC